MNIEGNNAPSLFLDKHRLSGRSYRAKRITLPPGAAREDSAPVKHFGVTAGVGRAPGALSFGGDTGKHKAPADNETSPNLTVTGAAVVGVTRSGSIASAEKGRRELSWAFGQSELSLKKLI